MRSTLINKAYITLAILVLVAALLPLSASMEQEYFVTGACTVDGVPAQGVSVTGPYGAQTASYPGGNYSLFVRVPDGQSSSVTITASYPGYGDVSRDLDLNLTTSADFNLARLPTTFTVSGMCRLNGTPSAGVSVSDVIYGSHTVTGQDGTYQINVSVPYGESTQVKLVASMSGYEQEAKTIDLNDTLTADFNLPLVVSTPLPSSSSGPGATTTANPMNQTAMGLVGIISANAYPIFIVVVLLIVVVAVALFYLKRRSKASKHEVVEPSREDIYKLVTGSSDMKRTRRTHNDKGRDGGNEKFKPPF